jgi:hypothetical protein
MSEYQYCEFCSLNQPISSDARKEMQSLSSRAVIMTHGASYVYNFGGGFRGDPEKLLLKYFDVYFFIANWGTINLIFKFACDRVNIDELKPYLIDDVISYKKIGNYIVLDITVNNEEGFSGWIEGEGILPLLLSLHAEINKKNYQFLAVVAAINSEFTGDVEYSLAAIKESGFMSEAQQAFIDCVELS